MERRRGLRGGEREDACGACRATLTGREQLVDAHTQAVSSHADIFWWLFLNRLSSNLVNNGAATHCTYIFHTDLGNPYFLGKRLRPT
jgi:hypothetical protein